MAIDSLSILFCEDVREETLGRMSLLGVYGTKVVFPTLPVQLHKLCVVLSADVRGVNSVPIRAALTSPQGVALPPPMEHVVTNNKAPEWNFRIVAGLNGLQINESSEINVEFSAGDVTIQRSIKFDIGVVDDGDTEIVGQGDLRPQPGAA